MKHSIKIMTLAVLAAGLFACTPAAHDPLENIYPEPQSCSFDKVSLVSTDIADGLFRFVIDFSNGKDKLSLKFSTKSWFLPATTFNPMHEEDLVNGGYSMEASSFNGKALGDHGYVTVQANGDNYALDGIVWVEDGTVWKVSWEGLLTGFVKPAPVYKRASYNIMDPMALYDGTIYEGVAEHFITVSDKSGEKLGNFEFTTESGKPLEGSYQIVGALNAAGQANNGYDLTSYFPGFFGGSYFISDGEVYLISAGQLNVVNNADGSFNITGKGLTTFKLGNAEAAGPADIELEAIFIDNGYMCSVASGQLNDYSTGSPVSVPGVVDNNISIIDAEGTVFANVEVSTANDDELPGIYALTAAYTSAGLANAGGSMWGMFDYGTWYKFGESTNYVTEGNVVISEVDGGYAIKAGEKNFGICMISK